MIDLNGRVAIVTGAGAGLGRSHALLLAARGARVVVNDLGEAADRVVAEIEQAGGQARAARASVTDAEQVQQMVADTLTAWRRIDILVNNAGILRDKSFAKLPMADFRLIVEVHLLGAAQCTQAVWETMRAQGYGRIVMTTSSAGLYGNFGQAHYSAAKMALVGLMQTLGIEGQRYGIHVNCIAPTAATSMLDGLLPAEQLARLQPELVSPGVLALVSEQAPNRAILCAGGGSFELAQIGMTQGIHLAGEQLSAEQLLAQWAQLSDPTDALQPQQAFDQGRHELEKALR
ncbi:MAG: SDR family NAD(P)-dependent oxidoreductase [Xanthomonadales bacterium]|nr:SDR family NAD(P)-dependent oxidoreductase [Xanthomonadales bacterium]